MPNFDNCERLMKKAVVCRPSDPVLGRVASEICLLPEQQKISLYKGRHEKEVLDHLTRAVSSLRSHFPDGALFSIDNNNSAGKDLTETISGREVELKSGPDKTDANLGLGVVMWALGDENKELRSILSPSSRRKLLQACVTSGGDPSVGTERYKSEAMDRLTAYFASRAPGEQPAPPQLAHLFRAVARGHTTANLIKASYQNKLPDPLLLQADWGKGLAEYSVAFASDEDLMVTITRTAERAQLEVLGTQTGRRATLYPHYKNSWQGFSASNWVSSPCFHVWVK
jgi:hypothetical protein